MPIITTYLDFATQQLSVPNAVPASTNPDGVKLQSLINLHEADYLQYIFGYTFSELFLNGIGSAGIYETLKIGATYTDTSNLVQKWAGFATVGKNPIACYIYWFYQNSNATTTLGTGEAKAKAENVENTTPRFKMIAAWNKMVEFNIKLHGYLYANRAVYPTYIGLNYPPLGYIAPHMSEEQKNYQNLFIKIPLY